MTFGFSTAVSPHRTACPWRLSSRLLAGLAFVSLLPNIIAQHFHINAGAVSQTAGSPLSFINGAQFSTNSGFFVYLAPKQVGAPGPFQGTVTFTALPSTPLNGGPVAGHALPGASLALQWVAANGPVGGILGFLEEEDTAPRFSIQTGVAAQSWQLPLSENDGSAGSDPYGHIHGRSFTATQPGLYTASFRILDTSSNGAGGNPLHTPSEPFVIFLQAGVGFHTIQREDNALRLRFAGEPGSTYQVESASALENSTSWNAVAAPVKMSNQIVEVSDPVGASEKARYYRLRKVS